MFDRERYDPWAVIAVGPVLMPPQLDASIHELSSLLRREAARKMSAMILKAKE